MKSKPASKPGQAAETNLSEAPEKPAPSPSPSVARLERILVATDFSEVSLAALDYAAMLAERFAAKLVLLHVVEPSLRPQVTRGLSSDLADPTQALLQAARERLDALGRKRLGHRLQSETLVRMGHAHSEIPDTAQALGADLIVLGTHGGNVPKHVVLGGTAERILRHASCPVLTVPQPSVSR